MSEGLYYKTVSFMFRMTRLIFYPHQLPPTLHAQRLTPSTCGVYDLTIFWFIGVRKPFMNDSSSRKPFNAWCAFVGLISGQGRHLAFRAFFLLYIYHVLFLISLFQPCWLFRREPVALTSDLIHQLLSTPSLPRSFYSFKIYLPVSSSSLFLCTFILPEQFLIKDVSLGT